MATQVFINLPVKDLDRSIAFFSALGYTFNAQFTDEKATCMIISEQIYVMLLTEQYFQTFTKKTVCGPDQIESIVALSMDSKEEVLSMIQKALDNGATQSMPPADHGFMYQDSFEDLDGHKWEYFHMDMSQMPQQ